AALFLSRSQEAQCSCPVSRVELKWEGIPTTAMCRVDLTFLFFFFQELFVQYLATYSYKHGRGKEKRSLTYSDLSHTAEESETFQFLADILPKKILASKYLKMLEREKRDGKVEDDEEDEDDDDKEEESEEEDDES
uniref:Chromatin accessibility complex protein 1 n=1 Tax=Pelodiscus sinensis TaxID=13735 RepID=K7F8U0_PELSI